MYGRKESSSCAVSSTVCAQHQLREQRQQQTLGRHEMGQMHLARTGWG